MYARVLPFVGLLLCALHLASDAQADARRTSALPVIVEVPVGPEGMGCYWERGRLYCSRYCYIEIDGRRFCRERSREAYSQAPPPDLPVILHVPVK